jgi:maleylacetoacetate isomerase
MGGELGKYPTAKRIVERCLGDDRFARAHPLRQPGAPH